MDWLNRIGPAGQGYTYDEETPQSMDDAVPGDGDSLRNKEGMKTSRTNLDRLSVQT